MTPTLTLLMALLAGPGNEQSAETLVGHSHHTGTG